MQALPNASYCEYHRFFSTPKAADSQKAVTDSGLLKPHPYSDSDTEKLNRTFDPLPRRRKRRKKRRRTDHGVNSELQVVNQSSDRSVVIALQPKLDSDPEKPNRTFDPLVEKENKMNGEKQAESDPVSEDLIRMAVKRQLKRREEREEKKRSEKQTEVRRELPNGVMAISPSPVKNSGNVDQIVDKKIGLGFEEGFSLRRQFRSKNVEPQPVGLVKVS